jgi:hypothetical protein
MSYSFRLTAASVAAAITAVAAEFDKVVASQPTHAADRDFAQAAVETAIGKLTPSDDRDIEVNVSGSVGWQGDAQDVPLKLTSINLSISAYQVGKSPV